MPIRVKSPYSVNENQLILCIKVVHSIACWGEEDRHVTKCCCQSTRQAKWKFLPPWVTKLCDLRAKIYIFFVRSRRTTYFYITILIIMNTRKVLPLKQVTRVQMKRRKWGAQNKQRYYSIRFVLPVPLRFFVVAYFSQSFVVAPRRGAQIGIC